MKQARLEEILRSIPEVRVAVVGDFFLDQYWAIDQELAERSIETGLTAHQVVEVRTTPGAAGTVVSNLAALGVGEITAVGFLGNDGNGCELRRALEHRGILTDRLVTCPGRSTPVYTKPMLRTAAGEKEMERFDIKNRTPTPTFHQAQLIQHLEDLAGQVHAIMIMDQIGEPDCGSITEKVRDELIKLAGSNQDCHFLADSRGRIGLYTAMTLKPNQSEAAGALQADIETADQLASQLARRNNAQVLLTRGAEGLLFSDGNQNWHCPAIPVAGPIDIVGAGDSVSAAFISSLCTGAGVKEAMQFAALVASITIQKIGTTGTASPAEIRQMANRHRPLLEGL